MCACAPNCTKNIVLQLATLPRSEPSHHHYILITCSRFLFTHHRCVFQSNDTEAATADAHPKAKYYIPHVQVSARVRGLVLPERCHMFYGENRRFSAVQLRVSAFIYILVPIASFAVCFGQIDTNPLHTKSVLIISVFRTDVPRATWGRAASTRTWTARICVSTHIMDISFHHRH